MNIEEIVSLYNSGESCLTISKKCNLSISTVRRRVVSEGMMRSVKESIRLTFRLGNRKPSSSWKRRGSPSKEVRDKISKSLIALNLGKGRTVTASGYVEITKGINAGKGYHRVLMEEHLGRKLSPTEVVHHIDKNRRNNNMSNLQLMTRSEHAKHHALENSASRKRCDNGRFA